MMEKTIVMSLGGSVIVPDKIDINFLIGFKKIIESFLKKDYRFVIYCGGGRIARDYQKALRSIIGNDQRALDWIGISITHVNAFLLKYIFLKHTNIDAIFNQNDDNIIQDPNKKIKFNKKILIAAGWKPGWSTDYDAVLLAKNLKVKTVINMSNIDYLYNKDPKKYNNAKKIKNISWKQYRKISGNKWKAGLNAPFDPIAAKEAEKSKLKVIIIGKNLRNFENLLQSKKFEGTIIE